MDTKYTKDGKKVAVLGKLNDETWIVQEIYLSESGQELPRGENFTAKTLLDKPLFTWQSREIERLEERKARTEQEIKTLDKKSQVARNKADVARLINKATDKYKDVDMAELDTLFAFMSGQITHIIIEKYSDFQIVSLIDAVKDTDNHYGRISVDGLKLVTLFGCRSDGTRYKDDRTFNLTWRINRYCDGSGSNTTVHPCRSYEEAVLLLDELVSEKDASDSLIKLKEKHKLNHPSPKKIKEHKNRCIKAANERIKEAEINLDKKKKELRAIK